MEKTEQDLKLEEFEEKFNHVIEICRKGDIETLENHLLDMDEKNPDDFCLIKLICDKMLDICFEESVFKTRVKDNGRKELYVAKYIGSWDKWMKEVDYLRECSKGGLNAIIHRKRHKEALEKLGDVCGNAFIRVVDIEDRIDVVAEKYGMLIMEASKDIKVLQLYYRMIELYFADACKEYLKK